MKAAAQGEQRLHEVTLCFGMIASTNTVCTSDVRVRAGNYNNNHNNNLLGATCKSSHDTKCSSYTRAAAEPGVRVRTSGRDDGGCEGGHHGSTQVLRVEELR